VSAVFTTSYGFSRPHAKKAHHYFTALPSYWNIVAFYLYTLGWPPVLNAAVVLVFSVAVFVPIRYLYPSRTPVLRPLTVGLGLVWGAIVIWSLTHLATVPRGLVVASLLF